MGVTVLGIQHRVALRKESVDRNAEDWLNAGTLPRVALRKESVDRNIDAQYFSVCVIGRSPQGERG